MFASLSIRTKITTLVAVLLIAMSGLGALGLFKMRTLNVSTIDIGTNWLPSIRVLGELRAGVLMYRNSLRVHLMELTAEGKTNAEKRQATADAVVKKARAAYEPLISSPEEKANYENWVKEWNTYTAESQKVFEMSRKTVGQFSADANDYLAKSVTPVGNRMDDYLQKAIDLNNKGAEESTMTAASTYSSALVEVIGIIASNKSTSWTNPRSITSKARSSESNGMPISRAKTFIVPAGSTPSTVGDPARPLTTSLSVPSPPAAITTGSPSAAKRAASSRASPAWFVGYSAKRSAWLSMNRSTRPPFWLRARGLKMSGYRCGVSMPDSSPMARRFRNPISPQGRNHLGHRQAHHVFETAADPGDDPLAVFLDAVGPGLVQRIDEREIVVDRRIVER